MHPLETRDVAAAGIIRECTAREKGVTTPLGSGVWLDTPMIEELGGEGTIEKRIPAMLRMYLRYDICLLYTSGYARRGSPFIFSTGSSSKTSMNCTESIRRALTLRR